MGAGCPGFAELPGNPLQVKGTPFPGGMKCRLEGDNSYITVMRLKLIWCPVCHWESVLELDTEDIQDPTSSHSKPLLYGTEFYSTLLKCANLPPSFKLSFFFSLSTFRNRLTGLKPEVLLDPIYIGLFGSTGAGKSTLLNTIIDKNYFLPVSGNKACTSCVVQVNTSHSKQHEAKIHLLTDEAGIIFLFLTLKGKETESQQASPDGNVSFWKGCGAGEDGTPMAKASLEK